LLEEQSDSSDVMAQLGLEAMALAWLSRAQGLINLKPKL